jgi:hypothetical protein
MDEIFLLIEDQGFDGTKPIKAFSSWELARNWAVNAGYKRSTEDEPISEYDSMYAYFRYVLGGPKKFPLYIREVEFIA